MIYLSLKICPAESDSIWNLHQNKKEKTKAVGFDMRLAGIKTFKGSKVFSCDKRHQTLYILPKLSQILLF